MSNENINNQEQKIENKKATKKIYYFLTALASLGIAYGAYWNFYASNFEETENAYVNGNQNLVTSNISGNITGIYIKDGLSVKQGDLAIKIDDTDYKISLSKAENDLAKQVRNYKTLQINKNQSKEQLNIKLQEFNKINDDYQRDLKAINSGIMSKEQFENSKFKMEQSKLNLESAQLGLDNSINQSFSTTLISHPDIQKAINQYKQTYIDLTRTTIKIPTNGIIAKKNIFIGQKIIPNQSLFNVVDLQTEWVDANLKEFQLKKIKPGQLVELESDVNGKTYIGFVASIGAGSGSSLSLLPAQNATGNWIKVVQRVPVRIELTKKSLETNGYLPIGTSMRINIDTRKIESFESNIKQELTIDYDEQEINKQINKIIKQNLTN